MATIALDPGHGGEIKTGDSESNNAEGPTGLLEKHVTLQVAQVCGQALSARGHNILYTRTSDVNLGLKERAKVARDAIAEVFVSIHFNTCEDDHPGCAQGTETFVHKKHFTKESSRLASCIQNAVVAALRYRDRGTKREKYGVVSSLYHDERTAAVLIESSFMDRADEEALLKLPSHREKIAHAIADGIELFLGKSDEWGKIRYEPMPVGGNRRVLYEIFEWNRGDEDA